MGPLYVMRWNQELNFIEKGRDRGGLDFAMNSGGGEGGGGGTGARVGTTAGLMDHHSRLGRQQAEKFGLATETAPHSSLCSPPQDAVRWHHRAGPIRNGLNIIMAEDHTAMRVLMPWVLMPREAPPSL